MITRNKVRSFLTMLGIVIGVAAVIVVLSVGASVQGLILDQVKSIGSNLIGVLPGKNDTDAPSSAMGVIITTLKYDDGAAIVNSNNPHIDSLAMYVSGTDIVSVGSNKASTTYYGTTASYLDVQNSSLSEGRFFNQEEEINNTRVVVMGSKIAKDLFGDQDPLGQKLKIKKTNFTVIGILKEKGGSLIQSEDNNLFIPIKTAQNLLLGIDYISFMRIKVDRTENIGLVSDDITEILRSRHNIDDPVDDDFTIHSTTQVLETISTITGALSYFLAAIAAISLVVGGFGIMNIMLATVQERTKEIGLRKAVGAKNGDITIQFLVETVAITFISGIIGILVGVVVLGFISLIVNYLGYHWDYIVSIASIFLGCFVSITIGLIFGVAPARKASSLDPIEALRYE